MENVRKTLNGYQLDFELKNVPVAFVNAIRRIILSDIPTVVVRDVEILDNTSQMIHEMLRHRIEMLPINVKPEEAAVIRDTRLELRYMGVDKPLLVTSDDIVVAGPRKDVILKDRDLGTPHLVMKLNPNESVHIKAGLGIETKGASPVCIATFKNHIDLEIAKLDKDTFTAEGGDAQVFDNHYIQRSYVRDEKGRPIHFDFKIESIGVLPADDILRRAVTILQNKIVGWVENTKVLREEAGWYRMETETEGHTIGALAQAMMYDGGLVDFVSYNIPHPLLPKMVVRFNSSLDPNSVVDKFKQQAVALCESILKSL
jgi:DNA-directed RNA polymerase alpha subunit